MSRALTRSTILDLAVRSALVAGALAANLTAGMVLTGVVTRADVDASSFKPDLLYNDLPELLADWQRDVA